MHGFHVYDTTMRDGAQQEGINLSVADKLTIARHLDDLGVTHIEGGWPGANPNDTEFFARAAQELQLRTATLAAFGATRRAGGSAATDPQGRKLQLVVLPEPEEPRIKTDDFVSSYINYYVCNGAVIAAEFGADVK